MRGIYFGIVEEVRPPEHPLNTSKYQYIYVVAVKGDARCTLPTPCIKADPFGNINDYEDSTLAVGAKVFVVFPNNDSTLGVIIASARRYKSPMDVNLGHRSIKRFNEIEQSFNKDGSYQINSINGPSVLIEKQKITISNLQTNPSDGKSTEEGSPETITLDSVNKTLTINARNLQIIIDNASGGDGNLTISVAGDTTLNVKGNITATCKDATVTASGTAIVEGTEVKLGKDASEAIIKGDSFKTYFSTHTHPTVVGPSGPPVQPFTPELLSTKVKTE